MTYEQLRAHLLSNPEVKAEYDRLKPHYEIVRAIYREREKRNMTQAELARLANTKQSNISRFERGDYNPSLSFLQKLATALGKELHITLS